MKAVQRKIEITTPAGECLIARTNGSAVVYEFNDGSGAWLLFDGALDAAGNAQLRKECRREHSRRGREGLPGAGVMRVRRPGETVRNEITAVSVTCIHATRQGAA